MTCQLAGKDHAAPEVQPTDRVLCPVHGDLGSYADFEPSVKEAVTAEAARLLKAELDKALGKYRC